MTPYPSLIHGLDLRNYGPPRSSGIHLSSIIRHIALQTGELAKEYGTAESLSLMISRLPLSTTSYCGPIVKASIGFAWELWLSHQIQRIHNLNYQPGELMCDGVILTPDGIEECGDELVLHEMKATWKSSAHPITEHLMWMWQVMGLLYALSKDVDKWCLTAVVHPVYLCGDYRQREPVYKPTVIEFEIEELEANWSMIMNYKNCVMPEVW